MTRITPDVVRRAFEQIGGVATRFMHGPETADYEPHETHRDPRCCCGLYAVTAANGWPVSDGSRQWPDKFGEAVKRIVTLVYSCGFVVGWDGRDVGDGQEDDPFEQGYRDGQAAWEACEAFREPEEYDGE